MHTNIILTNIESCLKHYILAVDWVSLLNRYFFFFTLKVTRKMCTWDLFSMITLTEYITVIVGIKYTV